MMFHGHFMRSLLVFRCLHWPSLWGLRLPPGFCILAVGRWAAPAAWHIFVKIFTWKSRRKSHEIPASSDTSATFPICYMFESYVFPQQRKLGVFGHSKGSGASRSSQIRTAQGWEPGSQEGFPFPRESLGAAKSAQSKVENRVRRKRFPSNVPRKRFQSNVPRKRSQVRFPRSSQEQVPKQRLPARGSQARFPGTGSQARFPSKVPRKRFPAKFPSKIPRQAYQEQIPKQGFPARGSQAGRGYQEEGFQEEVPKQGSQEVPSRVPRHKFPSKGSPGKGSPPRGSQARVPRKRFPSKGSQEEVSRNRFPSKVPKDRFASKQASQEQVPKQGFE